MSEANTKYRLNNHAGPFTQGTILTRAEIESAGCDFDFWQRTKTLSKATDEDVQVEGAEMALDDAAMKAEIESRIRDENATARKDQDRIAAEVRRQWDDLREERHARIVAELEKDDGQGKGGSEKPGKVPPRAEGLRAGGGGGVGQNLRPAPPPGTKIAGRPLSDFDDKSDDEVRKMVPGNDVAKNNLLKEVREAQKARTSPEK